MNNKRFILAVFTSLLSVSVLSQINADIIRPSANADQFTLALKAEAALSRGQLSLNIPLLELKGKGYDLPVSLVFYNGDVTSCTEASSVGLGWALMAGGVIATTVRGANDDDAYTSGVTNEHHTDSNYIQNIYNSPIMQLYFPGKLQHDPMPDEQRYSLPGHSGTIEVSYDGNTATRTLFPDESYRIESTPRGYCIIADDGTKFYFEDKEYRIIDGSFSSTSWFLSRIETTKGGLFELTYENEEYVDLTSVRDEMPYSVYRTKRITSIHSDFGSIYFYAASRSDRGYLANTRITNGLESKRINKIELRDENGSFVKGYELDNSDCFRLYEYEFEDPDNRWFNYRQKLSSITQYDEAGNHLPPYRFTYSYRFSKPRLTYAYSPTNSQGEYVPYESWTSSVGTQAYVDLTGTGRPLCFIGDQPNAYPKGLTTSGGDYDNLTVEDYFCLDSICYPNGAIDVFTYEKHRFRKVNNTLKLYSNNVKVQGRCLAARKRCGSEIEQRTEYVYLLHDGNFNVNGLSSGVLTNPSIHSATYYTPAANPWGGWMVRASRITSGKPFNAFMGPPVCYTEVEEVEKDENGDIQNRTIHYFEPQIVSPPVNYIFDFSQSPADLVRIENRILGKKSGYTGNLSGCNNADYTYIAYPVGDFYNTAFVVDKPLKEVFIGKDGRVRSIKNYNYFTPSAQNSRTKYGYKIIHPENSNLNYYMISMSKYITRFTRLYGTTTTQYFYDGSQCDSICENYSVAYNKGRTKSTISNRLSEGSHEVKSSQYYYPGDVSNIMGNELSAEAVAMNKLVEKNIIADPIKTVQKRNGKIIDGECKDYLMFADAPLLKTLYKFNTPGQNTDGVPLVQGNGIDYGADLYKEGEVLSYDEWHNPEYVKLNNTLDRIYVWGYGGRFPIAVIDNMSYTTYQGSTVLKSKLLQLQSYKHIDREEACINLKGLNAAIRALLPGSVHITTYTYDPYIGMTSEIDDSNTGIIYTYDSFGRLSAQYDADFKKKEEYDYHYKSQLR